MTSLHFLSRLGWRIPPDTWKAAARTVAEKSMVLEETGPVTMTFNAASPNRPLADGAKARFRVWHETPANPQPGLRMMGAPSVCRALQILAIARYELREAGALDPATEKLIEETQKGALAWVSAHYGPRWGTPHSYT